MGQNGKGACGTAFRRGQTTQEYLLIISGVVIVVTVAILVVTSVITTSSNSTTHAFNALNQLENASQQTPTQLPQFPCAKECDSDANCTDYCGAGYQCNTADSFCYK
jgi:hypothetical protein